MSKTDKLFLEAFAFKDKNGNWRRACSGVDTDRGTAAQWAYIERCGYVRKKSRSGRGALGHAFSRDITDTGREKLGALCAELTQTHGQP